jgi:hypothetical protein
MNKMIPSARFPLLPFAAVWLVALLFLGTGCRQNGGLQIALSSHESSDRDTTGLDIEAQVTGPQEGLSYKWLAAIGECDPQESDSPVTKFTFASNTEHDTITLQVWRDGQCLVTKNLQVVLDPERVHQAGDNGNAPQIEITNIPPYDFLGGSSTHAAIGGFVRGTVEPHCRVILYAHAVDIWYIQPMANSTVSISSNGSWTNWTHLGHGYAALLVRPGYYPERRLDLLPPAGGYVLARSIVDGVKK